jgi:hypothetical protein
VSSVAHNVWKCKQHQPAGENAERFQVLYVLAGAVHHSSRDAMSSVVQSALSISQQARLWERVDVSR